MGNSIFSSFLVRLFLAFLCLSFCCLKSCNANNTPATVAAAAAADVKDAPSFTPITISESKSKGRGRGHRGRGHRDRGRGRTSVSLPVTSRWYGAHKHEIPSEEQILEWDAERLMSIQQARLNSNTPHGHPVDLDPSSGSYVVHVVLGQKKQEQRLIVDSGSKKTWVECRTCKTCFSEPDKRFNPNNSTPVVCGSDKDCKCGANIVGRPCPFWNDYGDKTRVSGEFYKDNLTLDKETLNPFMFGCVTSSSESPRGHKLGGASGIMGLHKGEDLTVFEQDRDHLFGSYFSYCLPPTKHDKGHLTFGQKHYPPSGSETSTKIVDADEYKVKLEAISIDNVTIRIREKVSSSTEEALIDSGTTWSWVPDPVYQALQMEFDSRLRKYNSNLTRDKSTADYLCYFNATANDQIPTVRLHFRDDVKHPLVLNKNGVMAGGKGRRCFQFKGDKGNDINENIMVIGSSAQLAYNVNYDLDKQSITFVPNKNGCPKPDK